MSEEASLGIYHHIAAVRLEQLRGKPKASLARTGRSNDAAIKISGISRVLGPCVHGEKFRPGEDYVVSENRVYEGLYILGRTPSGAAIFHIPPEFLCVFHLVPHQQPDKDCPGQAHQPVKAIAARRDNLKGRANDFHNADQFMGEVRAWSQAVGCTQL